MWEKAFYGNSNSFDDISYFLSENEMSYAHESILRAVLRNGIDIEEATFNANRCRAEQQQQRFVDQTNDDLVKHLIGM